MKCPYPNCRKDYNDKDWENAVEEWVSPPGVRNSVELRSTLNRPLVISRQCRFCNQLFHDIYIGHENFTGRINPISHKQEFLEVEPTLELLVTFPVSKTKFESKNIPKSVVDSFNEAERCRAVGSKTGTSSNLRKAVFALCDSLGIEGKDYREKIANLPVKELYRELLTQIKWLGDYITKPNEEKYTIEMVDLALQNLPLIIDDIYFKDERAIEAKKILAKARSIPKQKLKTKAS